VLQVIAHLNLLIFLVASTQDRLFKVVVSNRAIIAMARLLRILVVAAQGASLSQRLILLLTALVATQAHKALPVARVAAQDRDEEVLWRIRHIEDVFQADRTIDLLHVVLEKALLGLKKR
jgi:hypothetical protein